jgi:glycosyltransferase involved in cell wall biosynthesis
MRILWVKMGGLWPATAGGRIRSLRTISELVQRHEVTVLTTHGPQDDPEGLARQLSDCRQVISVPYDVPKRGSRRFPLVVARSWLSTYPVDFWKWRVPEVRDLVTSFISGGTVDLCVSDFQFAAVNVPLGGPTPTVLFAHNVEYLIWQRLAAIESIPWKRALLEVEWRKVRAREADTCARVNLTLAVSEDDRRRLAALAPAARFASVPTGVDVDYFRSTPGREVPTRLVFSGSMDWQPNEDAVLYFLDAILPRIRTEIPDVSFTVVGRNPTVRLREAATRSGITVTGTVDDVRPSIDEASVYVVPLRVGGGTRLKIFEALAMSKPVVSTTVGAEGLDLTPGRHCVLADDAESFAREVVSLVRNRGRRDALGAAGRTLVETLYSWRQVAREFETRCEEVVAEHGYIEKRPDRCADLPRGRSPRPRRLGVVAREHDAVGGAHHHL